MEPFRYHVYVCDQQKPEGVPCCTARGSRDMIDALRREVSSQGLANAVQIIATVRTTAKTGVEMEALTAVSVAALTIYDMCKAVDKGMSIGEICVTAKLKE